MLRITDPEQSRSFYEALELTFNHDGRRLGVRSCNECRCRT
jgi:hypothetical protein